MNLISLMLMLGIGATSFAQTPCIVFNSAQQPLDKLHDDLYQILSQAEQCPSNVLELEEEFRNSTWQVSSYMVANRGRLNPALGSFSFFEVAQKNDREIFIGHFTSLHGATIELDQTPKRGKLLIEAISFDQEKGQYNFYELIGKSNTKVQWYYRGDSQDALLDNQYLHRQPPPGEQKFGNRMRCSACHNAGGPIMKELSSPHNDWWQKEHALTFGTNALAPLVQERVQKLDDAKHLAHKVIEGNQKLFHSASYQAALKNRSWQEILRPLFCTTEINLASSTTRLKDNEETFLVPSEFFINPLLAPIVPTFTKADYQRLLNRCQMRFPEIGEQDADHMWLSPAISRNDIAAIENLVNNGAISQKNAIDILMIDFKTPIFSASRCSLLAHVPSGNVPDWLLPFKTSLSRSDQPQAQELLKYLADDSSLKNYHQPAIIAYGRELMPPSVLDDLFSKLLAYRNEAFTNEISQNPKGQILEPGFRVIFPKPSF